jgi:hypothetical protein
MNPAVLSVRPAFFQVPAHQDQDLYEWWRSDAFAARRQKPAAGWRLMAVPIRAIIRRRISSALDD